MRKLPSKLRHEGAHCRRVKRGAAVPHDVRRRPGRDAHRGREVEARRSRREQAAQEGVARADVVDDLVRGDDGAGVLSSLEDRPALRHSRRKVAAVRAAREHAPALAAAGVAVALLAVRREGKRGQVCGELGAGQVSRRVAGAAAADCALERHLARDAHARRAVRGRQEFDSAPILDEVRAAVASLFRGAHAEAERARRLALVDQLRARLGLKTRV